MSTQMSSARYKTIVGLLAGAALYGCAGNGNGLDSNGNPVTPGSGDSGVLTADFQSIQDNVFTPICSKCHIGASAPQNLQLDAAHSYAALVSVPSSEQPAVLRIAPGDPDSSYLVRKISNTPGISGVQMPANGPPYLPQATIDVIRQWVTNGAPKPAAAQSIEAAAKSVQRFEVASTSPDSNAVVSEDVSQIVLSFNGDIDSTLINTTTVTLDTVEGSAPGTPVLMTAAVPSGNAATILIEPQAPLTNGTYRVTLRGSLANMNAQALGTDVSITFTVDALK